MGTVTSGLTGANFENANRALERFEVRAQRLQLDVAALAAGAANPSQAAQRLAESNDYLGQVIQGLQGTNTGLGLPKMTGPDTREAPEGPGIALQRSQCCGSPRGCGGAGSA